MRQRMPRGQHKITCSKCGKELEPERQKKYRYCRSCHAEYMREVRSQNAVAVNDLRN